jgi:hypothetical protein
MITGTILRMLAGIANALLSVMPHVSVPSWLNAGGAVNTVFQAAGSMGAWFPVGLVVTVATAVLSIWLVGFAIKAVRMGLSVLTGGGGSAS